MYTGLVEYSLIGVAVMYIVWRNIKNEEEKNNHPKHKETRIKVNFKHTLYGNFQKFHATPRDCVSFAYMNRGSTSPRKFLPKVLGPGSFGSRIQGPRTQELAKGPKSLGPGPIFSPCLSI